MKIQRFEDIQAWQTARELVRLVYGATAEGPLARDYRLRDQIQGAAVSVMANIAEGFDSQSDAEFVQFLYYARRSASEVQSLAYVALDQSYLAEAQFEAIYTKAADAKGLIMGFIRYLRSQPRSKRGKV